MRNMGAISVQTVMEQSELIKDTSIELERIKKEQKTLETKDKQDTEDTQEDSVKE
jgi:hypothetical protein